MQAKNLPETTDQNLISAYLKGNSRAFSVLLNRHKVRIFTSIYFIVKDRYVSEDIFQDVFMRIVDTFKAEKYNEEGKFLPWAIRIAHNMSIDYLRKKKQMPVIRTNDNEDIFEVLNFCEASQADSHIISRQSVDTVKKMVDQLPDDLREVVILRHYAELSFKEIAAITNCKLNTALGRMRYALINLKGQADQCQLSI